jgi:hypothetical protein
MPYIGNPIYQSAFVTDQFSGDGTTTAFTMSVSPAGVTNVLVVVSGVVQDPSTYGVVGTTLNFTAAPPSGTGNISCRYLGVPVTGVTTTAYRTVTEFTATASQTTFTPPSYNVGFINVYLNGVLLGSADYTATNGTTVVLATGASAGNILTVESFQISSVANAIQNTAGAVTSSNIQTSVSLTTPTINQINTSVAYTSLGAGNASIMKNRIINGAMVIDQRNAGAEVNPAVSANYYLDRWQAISSVASKFKIGQNAGSITPPIGFVNYLGVTSLSAYSSGAGDIFAIDQRIEGYNLADLNWGTANAKTVTLSFQVYSSLTGTFGGSLRNADANRSYPFAYTISSANTWTSISVTITGDTTGTWLTTNGVGVTVYFNLGSGTTFQSTAGAWAAGNYLSATGATSVVGTSGATFYITGVQLEVGSSATGFEYVNYQTSLANCQRYYQKVGGFYAVGFNTTTLSGSIGFSEMRTSPTISVTGALEVTDFVAANYTQSSGSASISGAGSRVSSRGVMVDFANFTSTTAYRTYGNLPQINNLVLSAEL